MISETLLYQKISARIDEEQDPAIEKAVDKAVAHRVETEAGGSIIRLEKQLARRGTDLQDLRKELRRQILTQQYLREKFRPKVIVTRDDLWEYYQSHPKEFFRPGKIHLLAIEIDTEKFLPEKVNWSQADNEQKRLAEAMVNRQLASVRKRLASGEDFSTVAKTFSTALSKKLGGDLGWITRGSYRIKQLEDEAFKLNPGQISKPITIGRKTYLLKVAAKKEARKISFCNAQSQIRTKLEQQIYSRLINHHLMGLWKKSHIDPINPFVHAVLLQLPDYETLRKQSLKE